MKNNFQKKVVIKSQSEMIFTWSASIVKFVNYVSKKSSEILIREIPGDGCLLKMKQTK